ncbi:MAG: DUF2971 domain-containing protein [Bacteroidota bacterium]
MKKPKVLYKYRSYDNEFGKRNLTHNELFFAKPNDFNDPFDCKITVSYDELKDTYKLFEYASQIVVRQQKETNVKLGKKKQIKEVYRIAELIHNDIEGFQKRNDHFIMDKINTHIGIISFSMVFDNVLMWSHYADFHKGYCIGYNTEVLKDELGATNGGKVKYSNDYPSIDPSKEIDLLTSWIQVNYKAECWSYEEEFRITKLFKNKNLSRVVKLTNAAFEEIILGTHISKSNKDEIMKLAKEKDIQKIYQMKMKPKSFNLYREELNY